VWPHYLAVTAACREKVKTLPRKAIRRVRIYGQTPPPSGREKTPLRQKPYFLSYLARKWLNIFFSKMCMHARSVIKFTASRSVKSGRNTSKGAALFNRHFRTFPREFRRTTAAKFQQRRLRVLRILIFPLNVFKIRVCCLKFVILKTFQKRKKIRSAHNLNKAEGGSSGVCNCPLPSPVKPKLSYVTLRRSLRQKKISRRLFPCLVTDYVPLKRDKRVCRRLAKYCVATILTCRGSLKARTFSWFPHFIICVRDFRRNLPAGKFRWKST